MNTSSGTIVLASSSPRRKELMSRLHIPFQIIPAQGEEQSHALLPADYVQDLAHDKAQEVYEFCRRTMQEPVVVIGADTVVACDNEILGKPENKQDAYRMISKIQGRSHSALTGVSVMWTNENGDVSERRFAEETRVEVYAMTDAEIQAYVQTPAPDDKAGAYGIQGDFSVFIKEIEGDYNTVVGLPIAKLYHVLKEQNLI